MTTISRITLGALLLLLIAMPAGLAAQAPAPAAPPECGSAPSLAKAALGGFIYALSFRGGTGSAVDELMGTEPSALLPVSDQARCIAIIAGAPQSNEPLPLLGILSVGGQGLVIVRGTPPATVDGPGEMTYAYLGADLTLRAFHRVKS